MMAKTSLGAMDRWYFHYEGLDYLASDWQRIIGEIENNKALGNLVMNLAERGRDFAQEVTHKITGTLAVSHRMVFNNNGIDFRKGPEAHIFVGPLINPISGKSTVDYAWVEDARGGDHAFYQIVVEEGFPRWAQSAMEEFAKELFR